MGFLFGLPVGRVPTAVERRQVQADLLAGVDHGCQLAGLRLAGKLQPSCSCRCARSLQAPAVVRLGAAFESSMDNKGNCRFHSPRWRRWHASIAASPSVSTSAGGRSGQAGGHGRGGLRVRLRRAVRRRFIILPSFRPCHWFPFLGTGPRSRHRHATLVPAPPISFRNRGCGREPVAPVPGEPVGTSGNQ